MGDADLLDAIVAHGRAHIVTDSWAVCDVKNSQIELAQAVGGP